MDAIKDELQKATIKDWLGANTKVNVTKLDATRTWRDHIPGTGVKLEGGLLRDSEGNHLFMALLRKGRMALKQHVAR